jgi:hypothetical protein
MFSAALVLIVAQAAPPPPAPAPPRWGASILSEVTRERFTYHIENPSSYDTPELVPHFFEQTYDANNLWIGARVTHPLGRERGELEFALTPQRTRRADDFDTFFQPDGNIVVTGTTGGASVRSWRVSERFPFARWRAVAVDFEYSYRRHRARYHDGDGITTTTLPPSVTHRLVTTRETAVSELHEAGLFVRGRRAAGRRSLDAMLGVMPVGLGRLSVDLPDKYPGRILVFYASVSTLRGRAFYTLPAGRATVRVGVHAAKTLSWRNRAQLDSRTVSLSVDIIPR